jgi:cell division septal protein FtsQ
VNKEVQLLAVVMVERSRTSSRIMFFRNKKNKNDKLIVKRNKPPVRRDIQGEKITLARFLYYVLWVLFFSISIYIFLFSHLLSVQKLSVSGVKELSYENVIDCIKATYSGNYLKLFPQNNLILISKNKIRNNLLASFPKIKNIDVEKYFPDLIKVNIEERSSLILWCSGGPCYIIDENGYAFTDASLDSPEVTGNNLIKLVDTSAKPVALGKKILEDSFINYLLSLREELKKADINVGEEWKTPSLVAEEVEIPTNEGWRIYFSGSFPPDEAVRTLKTFLAEEVPQEKRSLLEYVDLRVENKVYYIIKGEEGQKDVQNATEENKPEPEKKKTKKN